MTTTTTRPSPPEFTPDAEPLDVMGWALHAHPDLTMPSAFNLNGVVLIDVAYRAGYRGEVVFVDTGYHFPETLDTRDRLAARYPELDFVTLTADLPLDGRHETDPDGCCAARKVAPLASWLDRRAPSALLNARSREQTRDRATIDFVEDGGARRRINPLAFHTRQDLETYAYVHELPVSPLYALGYLSVGCAPCTRAVREGEDVRAGRWAGRAKTECGLWTGGSL